MPNKGKASSSTSLRGTTNSDCPCDRALASKASRPSAASVVNSTTASALGLTGTPSYVVGDQILSGAVGYDVLAKAVADARANKAKTQG